MNFPDESKTGMFYRIELKPNCSLSVRGALFFFSSLCVLCFGIAALFAAQGFWPVLSFAGLEMFVLGWALGWSLRRRYQVERLTISHEQVLVETETARASERLVFPRHWARVTLRAPQSALHPSRLLIESRGHAVEVGGFLMGEERRALAARLQQLIGNVNSSPPLEESMAARASAR